MNNSNKTYRVEEINRVIKGIIEGSCPYPVWVQGEISDFDKNKEKDNIYFQLSEKSKSKNENVSSIKCVLYQPQKQIIRLRMKEAGMKVAGMDGLGVRFRVRLSVSVRYGIYSLVIQDIDPSFTLGKLAQGRQEIVDWLIKKNLIKKNRQLQLTPVPLSIGLITNEGEGYHDFISKLEQSEFKFKIHFWFSSVQGPRTEKEVVAGLDYFNRNKDQIDVLVLVRGGGSSTDLSWFDNRLIAEKIAHFPKPVLTGIGHFTNISVADMVAYQHLATPTATAEFIVERVKRFSMELGQLSREINQTSLHVLKMAGQKTQSILGLIKNKSDHIIQSQKSWVESWPTRYLERVQYLLKRHVGRMDFLQEKLALLDPGNIIKRGFSITLFKGRVLRTARCLAREDDLTTVLSDGEIKSIVQKINIKKNG